MRTTKLITTFYSIEDGERLSQVEGALLDYKEGEKINLTIFTIDLFTECEIVERLIDEVSLYGNKVERKYRVFIKK